MSQNRDTPIRHRFLEWEQSLTLKANRAFSTRGIGRFFGYISRLGNGSAWFAVIGGLLLYDPWQAWRTAIHMLGVIGIGMAIYYGLKKTTSRPRPCAVDQNLHISIPPLDRYSFPSGHTLHAVSLTIIAAFYYPHTLWLLAPFALLVATSRLVLGLHYLSDVLAGALLGATLAVLSIAIVF
jgi:undecaprenyl-diphosphatase